MNAPSDEELLHRLEAAAGALFDGHVTIMRFTTNWRVGFGTPNDHFDISAMPAGSTFAEAAQRALARLRELQRADQKAELRKYHEKLAAFEP